VGGLFSEGRGNLGIEVGRERFQAFGEVPQAVLRLIRAHRFLARPIALLFLRLEVSLPGVVGVAVKVIVVPGELREMLQDVSGRPRAVLVPSRWGMGLGSRFRFDQPEPQTF
jgi:hypothetical protein